jgi:hypothetical protein
LSLYWLILTTVPRTEVRVSTLILQQLQCRYQGEVTKLKNLSELRHVEEHTVSISADGTEIAISLGRSLTLDATHLVRRQLPLKSDSLSMLPADRSGTVVAS